MSKEDSTPANDTLPTTINLRKVPVLDHQDIIAVTGAILTIQNLEVPAETQDIPPTAPGMNGLPPSALPDLVRKCQSDVGAWDEIRVGMSGLASDLSTFADASIFAVKNLADISKAIGAGSGDGKARQEAQSKLKMIFQGLFKNTQAYEGRAQAMADELSKFSQTLQGDGTSTAKMRERYSQYIEKRTGEIREFEKQNGLESTDDIVANINKKVEELNREIEEKRKAWIASTAVASSMGGASVFPLFWIFSIPGVIAASIAAGVMKNQWNGILETLSPFMEKLAQAKKLNVVKIWFDTQEQTFDTLVKELGTAKKHVLNLRGQWQSIGNELQQLVGKTGQLTTLDVNGWIEAIDWFREMTIIQVYENVKAQAQMFQVSVFKEPEVIEKTFSSQAKAG